MAAKNSLHININDSCNNNCIFCLDKKTRRMPMPSLEEAAVIFKKAGSGPSSILFTGPEPTVNDSLVDYIRLAKDSGCKEIRLVTNGRRLCYLDYCRQLLDAGLTDIIVSLHGSRKEIHDALTRTPQSFEQTIRACRNLSGLKSLYRFRWEVNITLNKINAADLADYFRLLLSLRGLDGIGVNAVIPRGRALDHFDGLVTDYTDLANSFMSAVRFVHKSSHVQLAKNMGVGIVGLPLCLFKGCRRYAGGFEQILKSRRSPDGEQQIRRIKRPERIKRQLCRKCRDYEHCEGVWRQYIEIKGWSEFVPVM